MKKNEQVKQRRRAHDVVIWQEQDEWVVYDALTDETFRYDSETDAVEKFKQIKSQFKDAKTV